MNRKALMGIEYTMLISLFILIITLSGTTIAPLGSPLKGSEGGGGIGEGKGGDSGGEDFPTIPGSLPPPEETPSVGGSTNIVQDTRTFGDVIITGTDGTEITNPTFLEVGSAGDVVILSEKELSGKIYFERVDGSRVKELKIPLKVNGIGAVLNLKPKGLANDVSIRSEAITTKVAGADIKKAFASQSRVGLSVIDISTTNLPDDKLKEPITLRTVIPESMVDETARGDPLIIGLAHYSDNGVITNLPSILIGKGIGYLYEFTIPTEYFASSLFVINANNIATISTCNNDGVCSGIETEANCPIDCRVTVQTSDICNPGTRACIGNIVYECFESGEDWAKIKTCDAGFVCSEGACVEPSTVAESGMNTFFFAVVAGLIVMAIFIVSIFIRR